MTISLILKSSTSRSSLATDTTDSISSRVRMFADARWAPFLLAAFAGGVAMAGTSTFVYLRFAELGADERLVGLAITLATVSEVPVFIATA